MSQPPTERRPGGCRPGMRGCRRDCLHRAMVEDYRATRQRAEQVRDQHTIGYATEEAAYARDVGMVTFRSFLESIAGHHIYSRQPPPA